MLFKSSVDDLAPVFIYDMAFSFQTLVDGNTDHFIHIMEPLELIGSGTVFALNRKQFFHEERLNAVDNVACNLTSGSNG